LNEWIDDISGERHFSRKKTADQDSREFSTHLLLHSFFVSFLEGPRKKSFEIARNGSDFCAYRFPDFALGSESSQVQSCLEEPE